MYYMKDAPYQMEPVLYQKDTVPYQMKQCLSNGAVPYQRRCNNFVLELLLLSKIFNFLQKHLEKRI